MNKNSQARQNIAWDLLRKALADPDAVVAMQSRDLDLVLRTARRSRVLGKVAASMQDAGLLDSLPGAARDQLLSVLVLAESRARLALWELDRIGNALTDAPCRTRIVMKGCAYLLLNLPNTRGRIFADVDLMFPESDLESVETCLNQNGWITGHLTPYDDNYYRKWTHELPPLTHIEREVEIDLHHNILPRTSRLKPAAEELLKGSQDVAGCRYRVLSNEDIVLHAITHLMFNDDLVDKLRDLVDIDELLQYFSKADSGFWQRLLARADLLDLRRPAYYGLRYAKQLLNSPIPESTLNDTQEWGPPVPIVWLMDRLVPRALFPPHPDYVDRLTTFSRKMLYVRSHWIRMPPWLLAYHLSVKFFRRCLRLD